MYKYASTHIFAVMGVQNMFFHAQDQLFSGGLNIKCKSLSENMRYRVLNNAVEGADGLASVNRPTFGAFNKPTTTAADLCV